MPGRFRHGVVDAEAVTAPVDQVRVCPHPGRIVEAARAAQRCRRIGVRPARAQEALQLGDRHRAVVARLDFGVGVELEAHGLAPPRPRLRSLTAVSPAAAAISSNRSQACA